MPRIFDNIGQRLPRALSQSDPYCSRAAFCVGYFNFRDWRQVAPYVDQWSGEDAQRCSLLAVCRRRRMNFDGCRVLAQTARVLMHSSGTGGPVTGLRQGAAYIERRVGERLDEGQASRVACYRDGNIMEPANHAQLQAWAVEVVAPLALAALEETRAE